MNKMVAFSSAYIGEVASHNATHKGKPVNSFTHGVFVQPGQILRKTIRATQQAKDTLQVVEVCLAGTLLEESRVLLQNAQGIFTHGGIVPCGWYLMAAATKLSCA